MSNPLEMRVREIARVLHDNQLARLHKVPNDVRVDGYKLIHGAQTPADFIGWTIHGRVIVVECKMCKTTSLPVGKGTGLQPHQLIAISEAHDSGGLGLLVWQHKKRIAVIDADQVRLYSRARKSIPWAAIPTLFQRDPDCDPLRFFWPFIAIDREPLSKTAPQASIQ